MTSLRSGAHSLAILDDYASIAPAFFSTIPNLSITSYPDTLNPRDPAELELLVQRLAPHDIISSMRERTAFPSTLLSRLPNLRLLLTTSRRNAAIDTTSCAAHGIIVSGTPGKRTVYYSSSHTPLPTNPSVPSPPAPEGTVFTVTPLPTGSTTQHTLSLLLALTSRIPIDNTALTTPPYTAWQSGLSVPLAGRVLGIIGLGRLGALFARAAYLALGMRVLAWSANLTPSRATEAAREQGLPADAFEVASSLEDLLARADVVSLHYVLSDRSRGMIGSAELRGMKRGAILLNTSRGGLVEEEALYEELCRTEEQGRRVRAVGLDVFWDREPLGKEDRWRTTAWGKEGRAEVVLSPHMGYSDEVTLRVWYEEQRCDLLRWLKGEEVGLRLA